ncbi:hypothetical protein HBA54_01495 [Pelagibius litoralis]|uniref:Uncharacterized protein n=1 Tax=Pelagibius litoralis TaxID=374515 RepID=A0A967C1J7_9PROT|nr:hypothetical protein [Pelagibius litoralis]NIA67261.1 hypothetical protein [Pelagibius litoralis]
MLSTHWFKQPPRCEKIKVGCTYKRAHEGNIVETAKVIDVGSDALGIPHVTYEVSVERARLAKYEERRTLGLQTFVERFRESIADLPIADKHDA